MATDDITLGVSVDTQKARSSLKAFQSSSLGVFSKISIGAAGINQGLELAGKGFKVVADVIKSTIGPALDFSESLAEIQTLLGDNEISTKKLSKNILGLQKQFGGTQKGIATAYYNAISSGAVTAADGVVFLADANKLAIGGVTDVNTAVGGLTTVISAFGKSSADTKDISDAMFIAMKKGKTTIGELSAGVGVAASGAAALGVKYQELFAATSALTTGGISTSVAFTQIRAVMTGLAKPSKDLDAILKDLNITSIKSEIEQNGLVGTLKKVIGQTDGSVESMGKLFGSVEAVGAATSLTSATIGTTFKGALSEMESASKNAGAVSEGAFKKVSSTAGFQFKKLQGIIAATLTDIGSSITDRAGPILKIAQQLTQRIGAALKAGFQKAGEALSKSKLFSGGGFAATLDKGIDIALKGVKLLITAFKNVTIAGLEFVLIVDDFIGFANILEGVRQVAIKVAQGFLLIKNAGIGMLAIKETILGNTDALFDLEIAAAKGQMAILALQESAEEEIDFGIDSAAIQENIDILKEGIADVGEAAEIAVEETIKTFGSSTAGSVGKIKEAIKELKTEGAKPAPAAGSGPAVQFGPAAPNAAEQKGIDEAIEKLNKDALERDTKTASSLNSGIRSLKTGGEAGAQAAVKTIGIAIAAAMGAGPFAETVGEIIDLLTTDGIADIILSIADNIPTIIERLAENMPLVALALIEAFLNPLFYVRVVNAFVDGLTKGLDKVFLDVKEKFGSVLEFGVPRFMNAVSKGFSIVIDFFKTSFIDFFKVDLFNALKTTFDILLKPFFDLRDGFNSLVARIKDFLSGGSVGGKISSGANDLFSGKIPNFAGGGDVPQGFPNDTFRANLSSGEAVITESTTDKLNSFIDRQASVEALLAQLVTAVSAPMNVQTSVELDGQAFADINLELSRTGARVA